MLLSDRAQASTAVNRRRFLQFAGALAGASALAGCSSGTPDPTGTPTGVAGVDPIQLGPDTPGVLYPDGYVGPRASEKAPFYEGSKTFRVVVKQDATVVGDWNQNDFTTWLEERTGLKVEFDAVLTSTDGATDLTRINAMLASGDLPDAFLGIPFSDDQISLYGQQGVFAPLQGLIETYAPETRRAMQDYEDLRSRTTALDGQIYQMKALSDGYHTRVGSGRAFINQAYLDAIGADMPTTTDELRDVLLELRASDPSPEGNIIPFAANVPQIDRFIMNAFLYNPGGGTGGGWLTVDQGEVRFAPSRDEWREGLRYMRSLAEDGLITSTTFQMTGEDLLTAGNQGRLGLVVGALYWGIFIDITDETGTWTDYTCVPPIAGPSDSRQVHWNYYSQFESNLVITSACEEPEALVQWADYQMEAEAMLRSYGGVMDETWRWASEGQTGINGEQAIWQTDQYPAPTGVGWHLNSIMYQSKDWRLGQFSDPEKLNFESLLYRETEMYEPFQQPREQQLPPLLFDESSAGEKADTAVSLGNFVNQSLAKFVLGDLDVDSDGDWTDYTGELERIGLARYLEIYQSAYEARPL